VDDLVVQAVVDDAVVNVVGGNLGRVEHGLGYFGAAKAGYVGFDLFYSRYILGVLRFEIKRISLAVGSLDTACAAANGGGERDSCTCGRRRVNADAAIGGGCSGEVLGWEGDTPFWLNKTH
jgi:hypothetical protein